MMIRATQSPGLSAATAPPERRATGAQRMIDVAVTRIEAEGMSVGLDNIRMEKVIEEAGVSRATAYRRWSTRDDFLADVLVETVRRTSLIPETPDDLTRILQVIAEHQDTLGTEQGRRDVVVEGLRAAVDADVRRVVGSPRWRTFLSLSAAHPGLPAGRVAEEVAAALQRAEGEFNARRTEVYGRLCTLLDYRLTPPLTGDDGFYRLGSAAGSMMTGIVVRALPEPTWLDDRTTVALFGQSRAQGWSDPERQLVGVLLSHLEPDPNRPWTPERAAQMLTMVEEQVAALMSSQLDGGTPA